MTAIGGAPEEVTLDGKGFGVPADANVNRVRGGKQNEVKALGNQGAILIQKVGSWSLSSLPIAIDNESDDLGYIQELAERKGFWPVTIAWSDGTIDQGVGQIEGEVAHETGSGVATITLKGTGQLTPQ